MKHIESIQPEYAADDMTALLLSDATASAALSRLLHDWTGCAIPPTADTPESEVEELVPLCLSILRRHWTTPLTALGDGTTPMSLADLMRRLIGDRVQGNEAWSIPPANANIPTAVAALRQRDMSSGLTLTLTDGGADGSTPTTTSLPDGISLVQLLTSTEANDSVTELVDENRGYILSKPIDCHNPIFQNLRKVVIGCRENTTFAFYVYGYYAELPTLEEIEFPYMEIGRDLIDTNAGTSGAFHPGFANVKKLSCPVMREIKAVGNTVNIFRAFISRCLPSLEHLELPELETLNNYLFGGKALPALNTLRMPKLTNANYAFFNTYQAGDGCPNLILLEVGAVQTSLNISFWSPTTALSERLPEFLSNFKTYIAQRLTDKGSGLTLTLSQAVRDAIQQDPEIVSIITSKGWTISPAPSV